MSATLRIVVPPGSVEDPARVAEDATAVVSAIGRIMHGRDCQVVIDDSGEPDAFALDLDGRPVICPPVLASQLASVAADQTDVPIRPLSASWNVAAAAPELFLVELARAVATGMPRAIFGDRAWATWLRLREQDVDLLIPSWMSEPFTRLLPEGQIPALRGWLTSYLGVAPPMRLTLADDLPLNSYAVALGGVRLPARHFLHDEYLAVNADPAVLLERGASRTSLPWNLREAHVISAEHVGDASAESWWQWNDVWAASVYADIRQHADWLVDDGFTDALLSALATTSPETAEAAFSTIRPRITAVLGRMLSSDVWTGSIEAIVGAIWDSPSPDDPRADEQAVRDRLAEAIVDGHLSGRSLPCWSILDAETIDLPSLVVAAREAVDALPGVAQVPVLLVPGRDRAAVASALRFPVPEVRVLALEDVPLDVEIEALEGFPLTVDSGIRASGG